MAYLLSNGGVIINDSREIVNAGVVTATAFFGDGSGLSGIATISDGGISIGDANITGNLNVSGISTVEFLNASDINVGGALTVTGDLSVGGDLSFDEVSGRNLNITGISTLGTVQISNGIVTATSGVVTYYGDGSNLTGIDITDSDVRLRNLSVTGVSTFTGDVSFGANASLVGDLTSGRNANLSGIATVNDIYIDNLLYDSNNNVGAAGSILVTAGGKVQWLPPDQAGIATVFQPGNTFFVSKNGDDTSDGLSMEKSFATISYALSQIPSGTNNVLLITAGDYEEVFPLSVPDGLTVKGVGQRAVLVKPTSATETNDGFQLGNASTVEDLTIGQMFKPQGASNNNYAFTYRSGATISTRGPYVSRVTVLNKGSVTSTSDPFGYGSADAYPTTAPGGAGVLADGSVLNSASLEASFLLNEVTTFTAGNIGIDMVNGARVEWLNGFSYFASEGVKGRADQTTGLYGAGKTRLRIENASGGLVNGNTVELYDIDGTTSIASGTIDSTSGAYTTLTDGGTGTFAVSGSRKAKAVSFVDTASLSTIQAKFGVSSLDVTGQSTDCINVDPSSDFGFGTGDFTVEFWLYRTSATAGATIIDMRDAAATDAAISIRENTGDVVEVLIGNSVVLTSSASAIGNAAWHHIAVARQGSTLDLFVDGAQEDTGTQSDDLGLSQSLTFGADYTNTNGTIAFLDELRIEKGAAKYTVPFTPSTVALEGDRGTAILLHLDGLNGATTTTDDIQVFQDIRISGGNTADRLTLADYSQFGAELRSSGCAVEYGNKGVVGDGAGVALRLIGINFSFVGALGDLTNDPNLAVQANEVTETNNAEVSFTSIDQGGDFRVGESFYVNQETGDVSFNNTTTDLTSLSSLTITDGTNNSLITPTSGRFGNVQISGQQVGSVSGDLDLVTAGGGEVNIYGNTNVVGILTAQVVEINAIQKGDTSIALDDTGTDGTIRFNTDGTEAGRFTNGNNLEVTNSISAGSSVTAANFYGDGSGLTNIQAGSVDLTGTDQSLRNLTAGIVTATGGFVGDLEGSSDTVKTGSSSASGNHYLTFVSTDNTVASASTVKTNGDLSYNPTSGVLGVNGTVSATFLTLDSINVNSTATELNYLDGSTPGSATASNAVVVDANRGIANLGIVTAAYVDATDLNVSGVATFAQISIGGGGGGISTNGVIINNVTVTDQSTLNNLIVSGVSTFVGVSTFKGDVYIDGNLIIDGDNSQDLISGTNLLVSGIATIGTLGVTTNLTVGGDVLVSGAMTAGSYNGDGSQLDNLPAASITTSTTPTTRVNGDTLQTGDLWYDSSELRQYTYYDDGGSVQWVPSSPEPTIPGFTYAGNTGIGTLTLGDDTFSVVGDGTNVVTTASGVSTTVTISLSNDVAIAGSMTAGSFYGDGSGLTNIQGGSVDLTGTDQSLRNLTVTGLSTFVGVVTTSNDVFIGGNLSVLGDIKYDELTGRNLAISGVSTLSGQVNLGDNLVGDGASNISGINSVTATAFYGDGAGLTGLVTELDFSGDTGSGKIGLNTEAFEVRGTAQQVTTIGVGNSVVIGLPNTVRVPQRLYVGGGAFTQVMDANSASGVVFANKIVTINKGLTLNSSDLTGVRNLVQTGIATLGTVNFSGVTTTVGNAFVGNDLSVLGTVTANDFNSTSDATKKEDVAEIPDALAKVLDLRGVTFNWKNGEGSSAGVLAQEVQMVLPEIVNGNVGNMTVQYNGIIALLIEAVKELSSEVEELKRTKSDKRRKKS